MNPSLDRPAAQYVQPGPDERMRSADEIVDELLAVVSADRVLDPNETRAVQRLMAGLEAVAQQKAAMATPDEQGGPSEETSDFGATEGAEATDGSEPMPGQEYAGQGY